MSKESRKKEDNLDNLLNMSRSVFYLCCDKCWINGEFTEGDSEDAYNEGWRATGNNVYCPPCAKKFKIK